MSVVQSEPMSPMSQQNYPINRGELTNLLSQYGIQLTQGMVLSENWTAVFQFHQKENERLEFLGDGILEAFAKYYLYRRFPKENEGFMNDVKIAMVCNENIGRIAYQLGLHKWIILTQKQEEDKVRSNFAQLGDVMESFIGALFLEVGFDLTQVFLQQVFESPLLMDWQTLLVHDIHQNYKNKLQVLIQRERNGLVPNYADLAVKNNDGVFTIGVFLGPVPNPTSPTSPTTTWQGSAWKTLPKGSLLGKGMHKIRKKAENLACKHALENMNA